MLRDVYECVYEFLICFYYSPHHYYSPLQALSPHHTTNMLLKALRGVIICALIIKTVEAAGKFGRSFLMLYCI